LFYVFIKINVYLKFISENSSNNFILYSASWRRRKVCWLTWCRDWKGCDKISTRS